MTNWRKRDEVMASLLSKGFNLVSSDKRALKLIKNGKFAVTASTEQR